jgi:hypothetical protein
MEPQGFIEIMLEKIEKLEGTATVAVTTATLALSSGLPGALAIALPLVVLLGVMRQDRILRILCIMEGIASIFNLI